MSKKITQFDNTNLKMLRVDIEAAIEKALKPFDLKLDLGGITYDSQKFTTKLTVLAGGKSLDELNFEKYAYTVGLKPEDFGRMFETNSGDTFELCGFKPRATKLQILAKKVGTDSTYKFAADKVLRYLANTDTTALSEND